MTKNSRIRYVLACLLLVVVPVLATQSGPAVAVDGTLVDALGRAQEAVARNDEAAARKELQSAEAIAPGHPRILFHLAKAQAQLGANEVAIGTLLRLSDIGGNTRDIAGEPAFAALAGEPGYGDLLSRWRASGIPQIASSHAFDLADRDLIPEGIAHDPQTGTFFIGSLHRGSILRVSPTGQAEPFAANAAGAPDGSIGQVIGLRVDAARRLLWAATLVIDEAAPKFRRGPGGWSALRAFDLATGREVVVHLPPERDSPHLLNDMTIAPDGAIYVSDSEGDAVYRLSEPGAELTRVYGGQPHFTYPNGLALSADGYSLYVAHVEGLTRLRVARTPVTASRVQGPADGTVTGIDGLYACGQDLIAVQALLDVHQVVHLRLDALGSSVTAAMPLERTHPAHDVPTTGTQHGGEFYYIASSQLGRLKPDGKLTSAGSETRPSAVLRLPLGNRCKPHAPLSK